MEIRDVEPHIVSPPGSYTSVANWVFVEVTTDDGTVGWGECNWPEYRERTLVEALSELGEEFILGYDPFGVEALRERLQRSQHFLHVSDVVTAQIASAIEMACWDIIGKTTGEPLYNLLGGRANERVRTYTYLHPKWEPPQDPEKAAAAAEEYVEMGFTGLKLDPIHPIDGPRDVSTEMLDYAESVVAAIREAVGEQCDIIIGTHGQCYTQAAIRLARRLEPYDPLWFEEPVSPENISEMATVADATTIPVATGERFTSIHQFAEVLDADAAQILQPNPGLVGILNAKKVAGMAESQYSQIAPWMFCGPIAGAANIHLDACTPNFIIQETVEDLGGFHSEILLDSLDWEDGYITPPTDPGLGVEIDKSVLEEYPFEPLGSPSNRAHYSLEANLRKMGVEDPAVERRE